MTSEIKDLDKEKEKIISLMKSAGFPITQKISVVLDKKLTFMGYTTKDSKGDPVIVVSDMATIWGQETEVLIHELGHIYRMETKHPSHNYPLLDKVYDRSLKNKKILSYQKKIILNIINSIEDLYADDIVFQIFTKNPKLISNEENILDFFLNWIHKPWKPKTEMANWTNAEMIVSTAFAQANLERHKVRDNNRKVEKAVEEFLSKVDTQMVGYYPYFKNFMLNLPERITETEFGSMMVEYIQKFIELTRVNI